MPRPRVYHLLPNARSERTFDGKPALGAITASSAGVCIRHGLPVCAYCSSRYRDNIARPRVAFNAFFLTTP